MNLYEQRDLFLKSIAHTASPPTITTYGVALGKFCDWAITRGPVTEAILLEYRDALFDGGRKPNTVAANLRAIKSLYTWLHKRGHVLANPMADVPIPVAEKTHKEGITEKEYRLLLATAQKRKRDEWEYAIRIGWATGFRLSDMATLTKQAVNLEAKTITLVPQKTRRSSGKRVEIPISDELCAFLRPLLLGNGPEPVCPSLDSQYKASGHKFISNQFCKLCQSLGIKKSYHRFRDAFISRLVAKGVSPAIIAEITGLNLNRIMTYTNTPLDVKRAAINKIIPLSE